MEAVLAVLIAGAVVYAISQWIKRHPSSASTVPFRAIGGTVAGVVGGVIAGVVGGVAAGAITGVAAGVVAGVTAGRWLQRKWPEWEAARERYKTRPIADQQTGPLPHLDDEDTGHWTHVGPTDYGEPTLSDSTEPSTETPDPAEPGQDTTTEGTQPMTSSRTSGEVLNMEQLLAELNSIRDDAGAELDDAQADQKRARDDVTRMDNIQASLETLNLDGKTLADIAALGETAQQRAQAADQRAAAADARAAQAAATYQGVQARHGTLLEAYQNTQQPADQQFYKAS